ncbi:zinc ion binding [Branchiostoma belcheri]|nr:zinc ion binding [Branchiostoma belcheri]
MATFMSGEQTRTDHSITGKPAQDATQYGHHTSSPHTKEEENEDLKQTKIVFGGEGEEPGQFSYPSAVIVSPSNELFVADFHNRRVQVFSMRGVYLRHFSAVVGEGFGTIEPNGIAIDGEGHLWVYGNTDELLDNGYIVRYTTTGHRLTTLHPTFANNSFSGVAVDTRRRLVVATEFWADYGEVKLLHFNGSVLRRFRVQQSSGYPGLVAVGMGGNLFVCDHWGDTRVHVYNSTGHYLFSFGGEEISKIGGDQGRTVGGERVVATGVCTDGSGNVLVAVGAGGNVEKFTEDGRYVRRAVTGRFRADSVAVAPGGQLVVADSENSTVTIFSHY